ncbi:MAG: hypothetical protein RI956_194 [Pseudomonadota bacterium]
MLKYFLLFYIITIKLICNSTNLRLKSKLRDVAQLGSALAWGARGREFKSHRSDKVVKFIHFILFIFFYLYCLIILFYLYCFF